AAYNMSYAVGMISAVQLYATSTGGFSPQKNYSASLCAKCGACEKQCPQHIEISKELEKVAKRMEPFWYRAIKAVMTGGRAKKS
ncbi:MAG: 4Fe-4S dicluster domain-containing protein, partial [Oscillospiraceae bacterium]|nr:4Fe-4S dicluster domain-containing protein [Oscillospiraceae bacterium]